MANSDLTSKIYVSNTTQLTAKLMVAPHGTMTGQLEIQAVESADFTATISVVKSASVHGKFYLYSDEYPGGSQRKAKMYVLERENLQASIEVYSDYVMENLGWGTTVYGLQKRSHLRIANRSDLTAHLFVSPNGVMYGDVDVVQPPELTITSFPIQDAFVRSSAQTLNYGTQQTMMVGFSDVFHESYRSLVQFDISDVPTDVYILRATLKLYNTRVDAIDQNISVMRVASEWDETTVTWKNQPFIGETLGHMTIDHVGWHEFDLLNLLQAWVDGHEENHGVELRASNEAEAQYSQFYTKEGSFQPVLEVVYHNPLVPSFGRTDFKAHIVIPTYNYLPAKIHIPLYDKNRDLHGHIRVKDPDTMFGEISVSRPELPATITIRQSDKLEVTGKIAVQQSWITDQPSHVGISRPDLPLQITVPHRSDLPAHMAIRALGHNDLAAKITVSRPDQVGSIYVRFRDDLTSHLAVRRALTSPLTSKMVVTRTTMVSRLRVADHNDLTSKIAVRTAMKQDFPAHIGVNKPDMLATIQVRYADDYDVHFRVTVRRFDIQQITSGIIVSRPDMVAHIDVRIISDVTAKIAVRQQAHSDLHLHAYSRYRRQVSGKINVIGASKLPCRLHVNSGYLKAVVRVPFHETKDLHAKMNVIHREHSDIQARIVSGHWDDLNGHIVVSLADKNDIGGKILIALPGAYAFIL